MKLSELPAENWPIYGGIDGSTQGRLCTIRLSSEPRIQQLSLLKVKKRDHVAGCILVGVAPDTANCDGYRGRSSGTPSAEGVAPLALFHACNMHLAAETRLELGVQSAEQKGASANASAASAVDS